MDLRYLIVESQLPLDLKVIMRNLLPF